ncbi:augmin complex subunit wac [Drosophila innubila]|uniref:augmin complex subunit wac n=1 Tax=Drosophila innubila TaxID=198719 RepID=UPI00148DB162|nr:augmin complex subunit wac [Drosophila innubila]
MDNLKLQEEINGLKNLGELLESQLKLASFELSDLPDDVLLMLDKCVEIQAQSHLHELNLNYLREFYYTKKRKYIEDKLIVAKQAAELKKLKNSIEEAEKDINILEKFNDKVSKRLISDAAVQRNIISIEGKSKSLLDRQKDLNVPEDFNIEAMIDKVETLERLKKSNTK